MADHITDEQLHCRFSPELEKSNPGQWRVSEEASSAWTSPCHQGSGGGGTAKDQTKGLIPCWGSGSKKHRSLVQSKRNGSKTFMGFGDSWAGRRWFQKSKQVDHPPQNQDG